MTIYLDLTSGTFGRLKDSDCVEYVEFTEADSDFAAKVTLIDWAGNVIVKEPIAFQFQERTAFFARRPLTSKRAMPISFGCWCSCLLFLFAAKHENELRL